MKESRENIVVGHIFNENSAAVRTFNGFWDLVVEGVYLPIQTDSLVKAEFIYELQFARRDVFRAN
jgi:hypothetical protein